MGDASIRYVEDDIETYGDFFWQDRGLTGRNGRRARASGTGVAGVPGYGASFGHIFSNPCAGGGALVKAQAAEAPRSIARQFESAQIQAPSTLANSPWDGPAGCFGRWCTLGR